MTFFQEPSTFDFFLFKLSLPIMENREELCNRVFFPRKIRNQQIIIGIGPMIYHIEAFSIGLQFFSIGL